MHFPMQNLITNICVFFDVVYFKIGFFEIVHHHAMLLAITVLVNDLHLDGGILLGRSALTCICMLHQPCDTVVALLRLS